MEHHSDWTSNLEIGGLLVRNVKLDKKHIFNYLEKGLSIYQQPVRFYNSDKSVE